VASVRGQRNDRADRCGSLFLAGFLTGSGDEHSNSPGQGISNPRFAEELIEFDARFLTASHAITMPSDLRGSQHLPRTAGGAGLAKRRPDLPIAIGGPSATAFADQLLQACDVVFRGRAEVSLVHWLRKLSDQAPEGYSRHRFRPAKKFDAGNLFRNRETL
jgi:hypothetical protein